MYPPGYSPPIDVDNQFSPLISVWKWYNEYYPKLQRYPKADLAAPSTDHTDINNVSHRPFECTQRAGDIMFLPNL